jgi:hypothetical protein
VERHLPVWPVRHAATVMVLGSSRMTELLAP